MDKLFVNTTTYTKDVYLEFLRFHNRKYNFSYHSYTIFWSFLFILCIFIAFDSGLRVQGVFLTLFLACFIFYRFYRPKMIVDKEMNSDKFSDSNTITFVFYDNFFEIKNKNGKFSYKYFNLRKVFETDGFFYLYVSKENAFLISKDTFSFGAVQDFSTFMKDKCGFRFR